MASSKSSEDTVGSTPSRQVSRTLSYRAGDHSLGYQETLMYGHYSSLRQYARREASKYKTDDISTSGKDSANTSSCADTVQRRVLLSTRALCGRFAQDWMFLTVLGITVALFSFAIDVIIEKCQTAHRSLYREAGNTHIGVQYIAWISFPIVLICFATGFTHLVGPTAIGSGIPEVKTILKGVVLKECLTFRTFVAKVIGLSASLGSGMPLGKVGPFVHIASVSAAVLSKLFVSLRHEMENESRNMDILTAAAAVGVSCTFAAPIGGVLFSIEATATYFAVRNYWRGFYSAICGAITFRLLGIWFRDEETLTALFKTNLRHDIPYDPIEILTFSAVGVVCGVLGALFVFTHKNIVLFIRRQKRLSSFLQKNRFIYPSIVTLVVASVLFPGGFGKYCGGQLSLREAVNQLFDNRTWLTYQPENYLDAAMLDVWKGPTGNVLLTLFLFFAMRFWMCAIATTMPVPCGIFIPAFALGASVGRFLGELAAAVLPGGFGGKLILPGYYATVGAAAFSGAVTHTVSTAVIVFELTGQMGHVLPCVLAVMVANVTAHFLQPSVYDAMIVIKKLPFLPSSIDPEICNAHQVFAEDFMRKELHFLSLDSTYADAYRLMTSHPVRSYPIVDSTENMELLGSIQRKELKRVLEDQLTETRRVLYFASKVATTPDNPKSDNTHKRTQRSHGLEVVESKDVLVRRSSGTVHRFSVSTTIDDFTKRPSTNRRIDEEPETENIPESTHPSVRFLILEDSRHNSMDTNANSFNEEVEWELHQLRQKINFDECFLDPAPFIITDKTSLYKVHSLFSLLSLHHAFVVSCGRLVGIVSMAEVRKAIEGEIHMMPTIKAKLKELHREAEKDKNDEYTVSLMATTHDDSASTLKNIVSGS